MPREALYTPRVADVADRTVRASATVGLGLTLVVISWAMVANTVARTLPPEWILWAVLALNVVTVLLLLGSSRPRAFVVAVAVVLGLAVAVPLVSVAVHAVWEPDPPVMGAVAGTAAMIAILAAPLWGSDRLLRTTTVLATAFVWVSLLLAVQSLIDGPLEAAYHRNERDWLGVWQLKGLAGHPNAMAMICGTVLLLQIVVLRRLRPTGGRRLLAWGLGPGAAVLALLWTQSRTGWIATAAALVALAVPWRRVGRAAVWTLPIVWTVLILGPPFVAKVGGMPFNGRDQAWELAERLIALAPGTGYGPAAFSPTFWTGLESLGYKGWLPAHAHNPLLEAGVQLGVGGLVLVAVAWCLAGAAALRVRSLDSGLAIAAVTAMAVYAGVEPALGVGRGGAVYLPVLLLAVILGSSLARAAVARPEADREDAPGELRSQRAGTSS